MKAGFSRTHDVKISIAVDIHSYGLNTSAHSSAVVHDMTNPLHPTIARSGRGRLRGRGLSPLVPIDPYGFALAGIIAIMCEIPLSGHPIQVAIAVQVCKYRLMRLRPARVNDMLNPSAIHP